MTSASHRGHAVTCHLITRISWYFSYLSCRPIGCWSDLFCFWAMIFAIFKKYSQFFSNFWDPLPPRLLMLPSWFPCYIPFAWHWSGAMFPQSAAPFRLQRSWWKCFCRKKVTCSDRLWTHHVIMLQSRLSLLRKLQWTGFGFMIMWLQRFGTVKFHMKILCVFVCLPVCQFTTSTSYQKQYFAGKPEKKDFFLTYNLSPLPLTHTHTHTPTQTHTFSCFLIPAGIPVQQPNSQSERSM